VGGIAQMMRLGVYRPVHVKTLRSQKLRMLLTHRKLLQSKAIAMPPSGGSRDRTKSPAAVSRKREYSRGRAETFGDLAGQRRRMGR
jgi:hypothetical protein